MTVISTNDTAQLGGIRSRTGPVRHGAEQRTGATHGWERLRDKPRVRLWFGSGMCRQQNFGGAYTERSEGSNRPGIPSTWAFGQ